MMTLVAITGIGYTLLILFMLGCMFINPRDPIEPPAVAATAE